MDEQTSTNQTGRAEPIVDLDCDSVTTLADAARLVDAAADDLEWTVVNPVDLPGMRKAAALLRLHAAAHADSSHAPSPSDR